MKKIAKKQSLKEAEPYSLRDSPLQWATRATQFMGMLCMCVAVLASTREDGARGNPLAAVEKAWHENELLVGLRQQTPLGWGLRYGLAVGAVAGALWLRVLLAEWVGAGLPTYLTFYPAIMVVGLLAGIGPGLLATALADGAVDYWILPPIGQFTIASPVDRLGLVIFTSMGVFMSLVAEFYRRNRDKAAAYDREAAARESQARLATFAAATFEGIVESEAGRIVDCNEQLAGMLGYSVAELRGTELASLVAPEDRDRVMSIIGQGQEARIEYGMLLKDGKRIVVEAHSRPVLTGSPMRHTAVRDITGRKRLEEERERLIDDIRAAQQQVSTDLEAMTRLQKLGSLFLHEGNLEPVLVEIVEAAIAISGADFGNIQILNPESSRLKIVAQRGFPTWWLDYWSSVSEGKGSCGTALQRGERVIIEDVEKSPVFVGTPALEIQLQAGVRAVQSTPLVSRSGEPLGMFSTHYKTPGRPEDRALRLLDLLGRQAADIIERAHSESALSAANEQLKEADRRKNEFLAVLSHELRNPLAPIRNSTYILEHSAPGGEQAKRAVAVIDRQAGQLARLVDDLLDVTRITRNKIRLQRQTLELNEVVRHAMEDQRSLFDKSEVHLKFHPALQPVLLNADRNRLAQVIGNLLQNAAKFTGRGGETRITVSVDATEQRAVVQVADTGAGLAPEMVSRLFQPFSQADSTLDRSKGGLGLGLALAKGLVELHGGDVMARSAGLGQGAEFVVRLPLAMETAATAEPSENAARSCQRVLVIEDNVDMADSLRDVLAFGEHQVEVAYNGREGISKAREFRPDVVLCDIGLPGMDGPLASAVMAVSATEAFINQVAYFVGEHNRLSSEKIEGLAALDTDIGEFERKTELTEKWRMLGSALSGGEWPDPALWQEFRQLVRIRNELVHFKTVDYEQVVPPPKSPHEMLRGLPSAVELRDTPHSWPYRLLTPSLARWSVSVSERMIQSLRLAYGARQPSRKS
ncbi:MAG: ATP-binding protein [Polyangia bacterium]|jgi:PAS domain S-box-containing protein